MEEIRVLIRRAVNGYVELNYPSGCEVGNSSCRFDLGYGPVTKTPAGVYFATKDTVVFQAKMLGSFKNSENVHSVRSDVTRMREEGMRNGFLMLFWLVYPPGRDKYRWARANQEVELAEGLVDRLVKAVPELQEIGPDYRICETLLELAN